MRNLALALTAIAVVAILALAIRELAGLFRLRRINHIHERALETIAADDRREALAVIHELQALHRGRP